jgi:hypothetical protein
MTKVNRAFSKEEVQMAKQKQQEEKFTTLSHKGNSNQNHIKIPFHYF